MAAVPVAAATAKSVSKIMWILLIVGAVAALSAFSWHSGFSAGKKTILEARIESQAQTAATVAEQTAVTTETLVKYVDRIQYVDRKTQGIRKEIKEVKADAKNADCVLPVGWRLLHDKAATTSPVSSPAGKTDGGTDIASLPAGHGAD